MSHPSENLATPFDSCIFCCYLNNFVISLQVVLPGQLQPTVGPDTVKIFTKLVEPKTLLRTHSATRQFSSIIGEISLLEKTLMECRRIEWDSAWCCRSQRQVVFASQLVCSRLSWYGELLFCSLSSESLSLSTSMNLRTNNRWMSEQDPLTWG